MDLNDIEVGKKYLFNNAEVTVTKAFFNNFVSVTDGKNEYVCRPDELTSTRHVYSLWIEKYTFDESVVDMFKTLNCSLIIVIDILEKHAKKIHDPKIKEAINELKCYVVPIGEKK